MLSMSNAIAMTKRAQQLLAEEVATLQADGKWGRFTQKAYESVSDQKRSEVDSMLRNALTSADELYSMRVLQKADAVKAGPTASVLEAIRRASAEAGVSYDTLRGFVRIESNFNPLAENGSSRGLTQMQPAAWQDVEPFVTDLPAYSVGVFDPLQNARAGAAYLKMNGRRLRRAGYTGDLSPAVLYVAHQQGASGFMELWRASTGQPSTTAFVTLERMVQNPPQDGKGVTTDKKAFFDRWIAAAEAKIGSLAANP